MSRGSHILLLALVFWAGCADKEAPTERSARTELSAPESALTEELMLSLGQARNYHHKADVLESEGKIDQAVVAVASVLDIPFPEGASESEDVILDTRARLAKLKVRQGKLDEAMALVDEGIAISTRQSFFLANLHTVRGEIFEAKAALETDQEKLREAKREAIEAFDASIQINKALLKTLRSGDQQ